MIRRLGCRIFLKCTWNYSLFMNNFLKYLYLRDFLLNTIDNWKKLAKIYISTQVKRVLIV